jgi:hypothetical protein
MAGDFGLERLCNPKEQNGITLAKALGTQRGGEHFHGRVFDLRPNADWAEFQCVIIFSAGEASSATRGPDVDGRKQSWLRVKRG